MFVQSITQALVIASCIITVTDAAIKTSEDSSGIRISNDRLSFAVSKSTGGVSTLTLDGQSLIGSGRGPYLDCNCIPSGFWVPGGTASYKLIQGTDSQGVTYAGAMMSDNYQNTGKVLEQYWFLRDGETGLHMFSRVAYNSNSNPNDGGNLGELRTLFRPTTTLWTHLLSSDEMYAPLPDTNGATTVQDATFFVGANKAHPYVQQMSDYFTKYMFAESWRDHAVHGMYSDGSKSQDGSTFGAWLVMNTKDTYFNGPTHSDLTVDGIVYNYLISNHHGNGVPTLHNGFDRTFGPQFYYFNKAAKGTTIQQLRNDALKYAQPAWNAAFYDSIAKHVKNLVPSSGRGEWKGQISLPSGAMRPLAVLTKTGLDFQDNNKDTKAYQYWADMDSSGKVTIPRIKAGTYRLTVYADGIFGQYTQDNIDIQPSTTQTTTATWTPESAGKELWRIGTPDKSAGEFRHGDEKDLTRTRQPRQPRLYWAVHDFPNDFPNGVNFKVGRDDPAKGLNYIHWSVFGGKGNSIRTQPYTRNVNNWTIAFDLAAADVGQTATRATFTVALAGVKTSAGNLDAAPEKAFAQLPYTVTVNGQQLPQWVIPSTESSSCGARSSVRCHTVGHKFEFDAKLLKVGENQFVLGLPANAVAPESAVLPESTYLQYDALRLEIQ